MPVTISYPGVYIEEISSGVRTITGVATSIAAFIGRAFKGPMDEPVTINSYADFERIFGGLWLDSALGFAVRDFYLNGGSQAIIVRLYRPSSANSIPTAVINYSGLTFKAASPGAWGNDLRVKVEEIDDEFAGAIRDSLGVADSVTPFNLIVRNTKTGEEEQFRNLTAVESARRVDRVLANESRLLRAQAPGSQVTIVPHPAPQAGKTIWDDENASSQVADASRATNGENLTNDDFIGSGKEAAKQGLYALEKADLFNLLSIPPYTDNDANVATLIGSAAVYCEKRRAMLIVDPPTGWVNKDNAKTGVTAVGTKSKNATLFFPRLRQPNPLRNNQLEDFAAGGAVAGIFARTDVQRGVWKAPAGLESTLVGVPQLTVPLTDAENGELNPLGINCLRVMPAAGPVVWGSRTLQGDDRLASEWKYIPVRRTALFIEESLYRGTQWIVFEPNDEPLWAQIRLNVGAFMHNLFRQGAFQGSSPREAYFVKCDKDTTTQTDVNLGIVNILVGFAPLKPAEFVVIKLQQIAGQITV